MTAKEPYEDFKLFDIANHVIKGGRPPIPKDHFVSDEYVEMITRCWDQDPTKRPTFEEIERMLNKLIDEVEK
jgi:hypothetical protein